MQNLQFIVWNQSFCGSQLQIATNLVNYLPRYVVSYYVTNLHEIHMKACSLLSTN